MQKIFISITTSNHRLKENCKLSHFSIKITVSSTEDFEEMQNQATGKYLWHPYHGQHGRALPTLQTYGIKDFKVLVYSFHLGLSP